jgi:hypothetical protein
MRVRAGRGLAVATGAPAGGLPGCAEQGIEHSASMIAISMAIDAMKQTAGIVQRRHESLVVPVPGQPKQLGMASDVYKYHALAKTSNNVS